MGQIYRGDGLTSVNRNADDPRLSDSERRDMRYQNFTFGASPDYAQKRAASLQGEGEQAKLGAAVIGTAAGQNAATARGRMGPDTNVNQALYDQQRLQNRLLSFADSPAGPSAAQAQMQKNTDAAMAANLALAGSGTGMGDSAEAMRRAQMANAAQVATAANDSAMLRAEEEAARRGEILQAYGQAAGLASDSGQLRLGVGDQQLQSRALNDQTALGYDQMGLDAYRSGIDADLAYEQEARANLAAELGAGMGLEDNLMGASQMRHEKRMQEDAQDDAWKTRIYGAGMGAMSSLGGAGMAMSDIRQKKRIRELDTLNDEYAALSE
jgi:hypothetical protein